MVTLRGRVRLTTLDVPVIVRVAFVGGAEVPPHPLIIKKVAVITSSRLIGTAAWTGRLLASFLLAITIEADRYSSTKAPNTKRDLGERTNGMTWALEVFERLTTKAEADALTEMDAGDTEQVADIGAPPQVRATAPLKPLLGVTCKSWLAVCPALLVALVEQLPPLGQFAPLAAAI